MVRVLLVDDHRLFRRGIRAVLTEAGIDVVGESDGAEAALELIPKLRPGLVLVDLSMEGKSGLWLLEQLRTLHPELPALMLSMHIEEYRVLQALDAGARGYLSKTATDQEFITAVHEVARGGTYLQPQMGARVVSLSAERSAECPLTPRELDLLRHCAAGKSTAQIAAELCISEGTIKTHLNSTFRKLEVKSRTEAVEAARQRGFLPPDVTG